MPDEPELVLHVWPGRWDLPTFTPPCLASILYLQLALPGKFIVEECTNPDISPDGQLPYLSHGLATIASFLSIVKYVESLQSRGGTSEDDEETDKENGAADTIPAVNPVKRAQETAWMALVSAQLGDLVACSLFTLRHNYYEFVKPALAELFPVPQRYYVPDRLRGIYKPRLEATGLWSISVEEAEEERRKKKGLGLADHSIVQEAFGKEKVLDKARMTLDLLARLLGDKLFFLDNPSPSALDVFVAAHILLLTVPPFPNETLRSLILESYPSLVAHSRRLQSRTLLPSGTLHGLSASLSTSFEVIEAQAHRSDEEHIPLRVRSAQQAAFSEVVSSLAVPFFWKLANPSSTHRTKLKSKADKEFDQMRWAWFGLAAASIIGWTWTMGLRFEAVPLESLERGEYPERTSHEEGDNEEMAEGDSDEGEDGDED
ncbi:hypothetical protein ACEPAF_4343 [Sanghuangporus sanghuang]